MGWEGDFTWTYSGWQSSFFADDRHHIISNFTPLVQWSKSSTSTGPVTPVCNGWYGLQQTFADQSEGPVPAEWKRGTLASGRIYYEHEKIPSKKFRWPFSLGDNVPKFMHGEQFLRFRAVRGWMTIGVDYPPGLNLFCHNISCFLQEDSNQIFELIALYHTSTDGRKIYQVMWIERVDGICYREGVGEVEAHIWERLDLEEIDVVLG